MSLVFGGREVLIELRPQRWRTRPTRNSGALYPGTSALKVPACSTCVRWSWLLAVLAFNLLLQAVPSTQLGL